MLKHPLLVIELGFHLELDPTTPYGFDAEQTLPCEQWLREELRTFDRALLQALLAATVAALRAEILGLGETVAFDVKHIYAWVPRKQRARLCHRPLRQNAPAGRRSRLSAGRQTLDQPGAARWLDHREERTADGGSGSGVAAATVAEYGDVVLAEYTQPFNEADVTYFRPLYQQAVVALKQFPTHVTADAAFDAWSRLRVRRPSRWHRRGSAQPA